MGKIETLEDFYQKKLNWMPENLRKELGHFNVFRLQDFTGPMANRCAPYGRKEYFKISLIIGHNRFEYADKSIEIEKNALVFANPQVPYHWEPLDENQSGFVCIFTEAFFSQYTSIKFQDYAVYKPGGQPIYFLSDEQEKYIISVFEKMITELQSDYTYKYDVLRNYVFEMIHTAMKMQPATTIYTCANASSRISSLFTELLARQFPITSPGQRINLRTANEFAGQLAVHVNHLNKALKETTGKTTTHLISDRLLQESVSLLKYTDWNVSDIAYSLGFEAPTHFNNFFKKMTNVSPSSFRK